MYRCAIDFLVKWRNSPLRKPLIIKGARQVGKTWLVKEFASLYYKNFIYVNFEEHIELRGLLKKNLNVSRIALELEAYFSIKINASDTLIFFDEIQEAENGLTSLKYFYENAPELHIIAAGSLLGILLHQKVSFPVGKVQFLTLYPLNFKEFLIAKNDQRLLDLIENKNWDSISLFSSIFTDLLKQYMYIGGMPYVVKNFIEREDWQLARAQQKEILDSYGEDFSKHAPIEIVPRILQVWHSLPSQLSKENKKIYLWCGEGRSQSQRI